MLCCHLYQDTQRGLRYICKNEQGTDTQYSARESGLQPRTQGRIGVTPSITRLTKESILTSGGEEVHLAHTISNTGIKSSWIPWDKLGLLQQTELIKDKSIEMPAPEDRVRPSTDRHCAGAHLEK